MGDLIKKNPPDETFRIMQEALNHGCSDGGCVIERTKGQHTNGGCKCLYHPDFMTLQRVGHMLLAAQDMADEITRLRADLAAAREQVAGAWVAAAQVANDGFIVTEGDGVAAWIRDRIKALTPSDATAALEARIKRERAEERERIRGIIRKCADDGPISYGAATWLLDAIYAADSRKAGGE